MISLQKIRRYFYWLVLGLGCLQVGGLEHTWALDSKVVAVTQASYLSGDDADLFLKNVIILAPSDNVGGIYSKPLTDRLIELVDKDKTWNLVVTSDRASADKSQPKTSSKNSSSTNLVHQANVPQSIDFEYPPSFIQAKLNSSGADGLLELRIAKDLSGVTLHLSLYTKAKGELLVQESLNNFQGFEIGELKSELTKLYEHLSQQLPFRGFVYSRQGQQITFNRGSGAGLKPGDEVDLVQILKIRRHPKLHIMVGVEKEIIGKAKIFKADTYLSFANIMFEKEPGAVAVGAKIWPPGFVNYPVALYGPDGTIIRQDSDSPGSDKFFGKNPEEWLPTDKPQYGHIAFLGGLGQYTTSGDLRSTGAYSAGNNFAPVLNLKSQLWFNSYWALGFDTTQSVFGLSNPVINSSPGSLIMAMSEYNFYLGYNFLINENFFGPKIQVTLGSNVTQFKPDTGNPAALTEMTYNGNYLGFQGVFQLNEEWPIDVGVYYRYFLTKALNENPTSGDSSVPNMSAMGFQGYYRTHRRLKWVAEYGVEYYSSSFENIGTRGSNSAIQISHKMQTLLVGIEYAF